MVCWRSRMALISTGQMNFQQNQTKMPNASVWPRSVRPMFMCASSYLATLGRG